LFNGEIVTLVDAKDTSITIDGKNGKDIITDLYVSKVLNEKAGSTVPIALPTYLYTFHKSQGLEFDNVAICIDDLFEFPMLYTGITRARRNVKFFTMNSMLYTELDAFFGTTFNNSKMASFNDNLLTDANKRNALNVILSKYINNGSVEINAIKNIYETKTINNNQ
jgi:ATP-dependent exoDNAse (exonuclease V) alpha subunit